MRCKYFNVKELVSEEVYKKYGEYAWIFIDEKLIMTLDALREHFGKGIVVNNWAFGGKLQQRGLRANKDSIVEEKKGYYISQHCLGKAADFNVVGTSSDKVFDEIVKYHYKFPYLKRIESKKDATTWTHIDCANVPRFKIFNAR